MNNNRFSYQQFTTLFATTSFIISSISGIILYITPAGRIAHWTDWRLWGLNKDEWSAVHTILGYCFIIAVIFHLYFNWKVLMSYIKSKVKAYTKSRKELLLATIISLLILAGTIANIPPFSSVMELGDKIKATWEESKTPPPIPHAEFMTLEDFVKEIKVPLEDVLKILKDKGIKIKSTKQIIKNIAKENHISPLEIYQLIAPKESKKTSYGYGKKTIKEISKELKIDVAIAKKKLEKAKGIKVKDDDTIKSIASKLGILPIDVVNIIKENK